MLATALKPLVCCPCPRCLVEKAKIHLAGTKRDKNTRKKRPRIDSPKVQRAIQEARHVVFKGRSLAVPVIQQYTGEQSMYPVQVRSSRM